MPANDNNNSFTVQIFYVKGLDCPDCASSVEKLLQKLPGVKNVSLRFPSGKLTIEHNIPTEKIIDTIESQGYTVGNMPGNSTNKIWWKNKTTFMLFLGIGFFAVSILADQMALANIQAYLYIITISLIGWPVFRAAIHSLFSVNLDINVLMTIAVIGAAFIGEWLEAATVVLLFALGKFLQSYTLARAERSLNALLSAAPSSMLRLENGQPKETPSHEIKLGDLLLVRSGEVLAVDATIKEGRAALNQASITGESLPRDVKEGDNIFAGSFPTDSQLVVTATSTTANSMLSNIQSLVENAHAEKPPRQEFIERFASIYTPIVIAFTSLVIFVPWFFFNQPFETWFYRGLILLVISCPCALVLASPVAVSAAISTASKLGILIKSSKALELSSQVKAIALDKTGTLSTGKLTITNIYAPHPFSQAELLRLTAALETASQHPTALAILEYTKEQTLPAVTQVRAHAGLGLIGIVEGKEIIAGNSSFLEQQGIAIPLLLKKFLEYQELGATAVFVAIDGKAAGLIGMMDNIRPEAPAVIQNLHNLGMKNIIMLTGDHEKAAASVKGRLQLDNAISNLMPAGKSAINNKLRHQHGSVMMVGDGMNDAPALANADVGVAMVTAGSTAALEVADIAFLNNKLESLSKLMEISKTSNKIIRQNIWFALATKGIFLLLAIFNMTNLWLAVLADTGAALVVILNSMRLLKNN